MRYALFAALLAVAACQTDGVGVGGSGSLTTSGRNIALASEPDCSNYPGGLVGSWCKLRYIYQVSGRTDPCTGLVGREGHDCRFAEVKGYADPVNNPAAGSFIVK